MEKKEITRKLKEILSKHEGNTSEGAIYWDFEWVGGKQIPTGGGGYRQEGGEAVYADKAFYKEMTDFISEELEKARVEGYNEGWEEGGQAFLELRKLLKPYHKEAELYTETLKRILDLTSKEE